MEDKCIEMKVAIILSMAGNDFHDFLPKFSKVSYDKMLMSFLLSEDFRDNLFLRDVQELDAD